MSNSSKPQTIQINWSDRWQVYYRLQALEVECSCQTDRPLQVYLGNSQAVVQTWSVVKQFTANRQELIDWLNQCWIAKCYE
ncbi:conserved hypothetical protein [Hyella patelloides LEGE 07179]|uniref:Uncharacterized protein n=1 Tax=Hyella patelloides LEGE 07179 TaxID=945734 RepID=A0A563VKG4_9CYAN|nr:Asr1405/Asl0597 family protein [Hyella patelloides]VEP11966.1 conserved hypothetical protein [Hyella patelloides LEGE 07179]